MVMGPLLEPLSVAIHAFRRAGLNSKSRPKVLIFGAGTIGLCCAAICRFNEANMTAVADTKRERLEFAVANGFATDVLTIRATEEGNLKSAVDVAEHACALQDRVDEGYDIVFECTGAECCTQSAIYVCALSLYVLSQTEEARPPVQGEK